MDELISANLYNMDELEKKGYKRYQKPTTEMLNYRPK
jgi:hypothetical protein